MHILVVDDQVTNREILKWLLEDEGHQVSEAQNGEEAVNEFKSGDFDLVLMDVIMPIMDGLEATKRIKEIGQEDNYVPVIFLTALDDAKALKDCLDSGGDDFLSKPYNEVILKAKIHAHLRIRELTRDISEKNAVLTHYNSLWQREQNIVSHIFNKALEHNIKNTRSLRTHIQPASTFNGDIVLSAPSLTGGLYVFVGDFTGHGLGASIGTLPLVHAFNELAIRHLSVGEIAYEFNRMLRSMLPDYMFCCATIVELNESGDSVQLWTGGLPDGYLISESEGVVDTLCSENMPLGIESDERFNKGFQVKHLKSDQKLIIITDGIIEAESQRGDFFGEKRLQQCLNQTERDSFKHVLKTLKAYTAEAKQSDDITLVEVNAGKVELEEGQHDLVNHSVVQDGIVWSMNCTLSIQDLQRGQPVEEVMSILGAQSVIRPYRDLVGLLISELYSNALEHGILGLDSALKQTTEGFQSYYQQREQHLASLEEAHLKLMIQVINGADHRLLNIRMTDSGNGFDVDKIFDASHEDSFGRGIGLIKRLCSRVEYLDGGSTVDVDFPLLLKS
ncbi:SpoIIE family protein phosphatase [Bermanella marisrubri]|uniref:Putative response regulator n=1 Tax=Bermanella marisrubri TaxID=207949 RepID=Q1N5B1_9GAMM|nr:fused response regulator/phosphatase [Bermanella marisrubri]EAT13154.1 putative response regulator [Oceanobacter sp. RED65] [Bermanella marisrubri]QIZ83928.1 SpoIIE family protein phosphatase [Bermanella marisrubri]